LACVGNLRLVREFDILKDFGGFFEDCIFCMVKYLSFHNSSFAFRYIFKELEPAGVEISWSKGKVGKISMGLLS